MSVVQYVLHMTAVVEIREQFARETDQADDEMNLARAALLIAHEEYPDLSVTAYLNVLDEMAEELRSRLGNSRDVLAILDQMNYYLFDEWGFRRNAQEYYDPRNSFLNQVIDRRMGIPITLSVIYMEVGWRLNLPLGGVGFPGHFLVKAELLEGDILLDPFNRGRLVTDEVCQQMLDHIYGKGVEVHPSFFVMVSKRQILSRMLANLKGIYFNQHDSARTLAVIERLLLLNPTDWVQVRDRGLARVGLCQYAMAYHDLKTYLQHCPTADDAELIRQHLADIRQRIASLN